MTFFVAPLTQVMLFWITPAPGLRMIGATGLIGLAVGVAVGVAAGAGAVGFAFGVGVGRGRGASSPPSPPSCSPLAAGIVGAIVGAVVGDTGVAEAAGLDGVTTGAGGVDVVTLPTFAIADASEVIHPREIYDAPDTP